MDRELKLTASTEVMHGRRDLEIVDFGQNVGRRMTRRTYRFQNHVHAFTGDLIARLNRSSVEGLFDPVWLEGLRRDFFEAAYKPVRDFGQDVEAEPHLLEFAPGGAYSAYNWEIFFHLPMAVAAQLSASRRFAEAQRWYHLIFDPLGSDASIPPPNRYWKFLGFRQADGMTGIDEMLVLLATPDSTLTSAQKQRRQMVLLGYQQALNHPFSPHAVARTRPLAYMYDVVMRYLDNLIAWGDHLYQQDTLESINEATQLYVLASAILGDKPQQIPQRGTVRTRSFAQMKAEGLDATGNLLVELEGQFPFNLGSTGGTAAGAAGAAPLFGIGRTLYFCVPRNDKLLGYWDTVALRLANIRGGLNLAGVARPLALFDPPIDPGLLVRAAAAGLDLGAVVAGLNQAAAPLNAKMMIQKAQDAAAEVRGLGAALLQAVEKTDAEKLALLRQGHEIDLLDRQRDARFLAWKQAEAATEALQKTRASARLRYQYYLRLLGRVPDEDLVPPLLTPDRRELTEANFAEALAAFVTAYDRAVPELPYAPLGIEEVPGGDIEEAGRLSMIAPEKDEISHMETARDTGLAASIIKTVAGAMAFIPDINIDLHYWGIGGTSKMKIGDAMVKATTIASEIVGMIAQFEAAQAGLAGKAAGYARRTDDWVHQANLAARELQQIGRQMIGSLIAEQIARTEWLNLGAQIEQSQQVQGFIASKFSNEELYGWMQGELAGLHHEAYKFAFDLARQAEAAVKAELSLPDLDARVLVRFDYWNGKRRGLLAGETLSQDLRRLEMTYHQSNRREFERLRHVSLMQIDPTALMALRTTGRCTIDIPEAVFDLDGPGQYHRRIRSVSLTIPAVAGPYAGIGAKLTLLKSAIRVSAEAGDYARADEDPRFSDRFGAVESVVASTGREDSGLFDTSGSDGRALPFEGAGAISTWQLELPADPSKDEPQQFDYAAIPDVILHIRYTAREGGKALRDAAMAALTGAIDTATAAGSVRLFSVRQDFPMAWEKLKADPAAGQRRALTLDLKPEHYPFWARGRLNSVQAVSVIVAAAGNVTLADKAGLTDATASRDALAPSSRFPGLKAAELTNIALPAAPVGTLRLFVEGNSPDEVWLAVRWGG